MSNLDFLQVLLGGVEGGAGAIGDQFKDKKKYEREIELATKKSQLDAKAEEAARKQKLKDNATLLLINKGLTDRSYKGDTIDFGGELSGLDLGDPALNDVIRFSLRNKPKKSGGTFRGAINGNIFVPQPSSSPPKKLSF